jgi:hypothetical protein
LIREGATEQGDTFVDASKAQAAAVNGRFRIEALAIVTNSQRCIPLTLAQFYRNFGGEGMFNGVVEGFLANVVQSFFDIGRQVKVIIHNEFMANTGSAFDGVKAML